MPAILQVAPPAPRQSRRLPTCPARPLVTCTNDRPAASARHSGSPPVPPCPERPGVGWREVGGKSGPQGTRDRLRGSRVSAAQRECGRDRIRTCVGNAGDFTGRTAVTSWVPSYPYLAPIIAGDVHKRPVDSFRCPWASLPAPSRPERPSVGRREVGGNPAAPISTALASGGSSTNRTAQS
jgi:hypothetical protein